MSDRPRVLVIEDEPDVAGLIAYTLISAGYRVETANNGAVAARTISRELPDLIVLDLMLPGRSGLEVLSDLRAGSGPESAIPVLILTARRDEDDRVAGFEGGADDYMVKPFSPRELSLRIAAVLRRSTGPRLVVQGRTLEEGAVRIDLDSHTVKVSSSAVELTPIEYRLLVVLVERKGRVQSRELLLRAVWEVQVPIDTRTVDTHILRLRRKLGAAGTSIETVRGHGYRFRRG